MADNASATIHGGFRVPLYGAASVLIRAVEDGVRVPDLRAWDILRAGQNDTGIWHRGPPNMATKKPKAKTAAKSEAKGKPKAAKAVKAAKPEKAAKAGAKTVESSRRLGLRGAAPWAARHAAKHAAEARARAAEPPPPGSARATIRTPIGAEDIKQKIAALHVATTQIKTFRKNLAKGFFDIGIVLKEIQAKRLFEAKGFGSFDAFLEREMELGRTTSLRLVRVCQIFQREAALELGMEKVFSALSAIELGETVPEARPSGKIPPPPISTSVLPLKPPGRS